VHRHILGYLPEYATLAFIEGIASFDAVQAHEQSGKLFTAVQAPVNDTTTQVDSSRRAGEDMYAQAGGAVPTISRKQSGVRRRDCRGGLISVRCTDKAQVQVSRASLANICHYGRPQCPALMRIISSDADNFLLFEKEDEEN
jgi:hypothetical protein